MNTIQRGTLISALLAGLLVLGGCASSGSGDMSGTTDGGGSSANNGGGGSGSNGSGGTGGTGTTASTTPTGTIANKSGGVLTATNRLPWRAWAWKSPPLVPARGWRG